MIVFSSVTYASRAKKLFEKHDINCAMRRMMYTPSCSYSCTVADNKIRSALLLLRENSIRFEGVYKTEGNSMMVVTI